MHSRLHAATCAAAVAAAITTLANSEPSVIFTDATGDIDPGLATGNGTLDLVSLEISNTTSDIVFKLTVNGNLSTDWGKFMIGISNGGAASNNGNGWNRPINMDSPNGGMTRWIGSWVDGGGGSQVWSFAGGWSQDPGNAGLVFNGSELTYTLSLASLGLNVGDTFFFDAYSSGGGGGDGAIDALANPNISVNSWSSNYTSGGSNPIFSYTVVPAPGVIALAGVAGLLRRRRTR
ncbi:MAG: hypothetical protein GC172_03115 [Phycisphaera sp.]|nr:hypothetical protein [Phycisphaera sp.]